jgi:hypothetical protein
VEVTGWLLMDIEWPKLAVKVDEPFGSITPSTMEEANLLGVTVI